MIHHDSESGFGIRNEEFRIIGLGARGRGSGPEPWGLRLGARWEAAGPLVHFPESHLNREE
jgi:hypothetical protein